VRAFLAVVASVVALNVCDVTVLAQGQKGDYQGDYLWEGWHKVPNPSHIQYNVFHDKVVALSNLNQWCGLGVPSATFSISGKIAKVNLEFSKIANFVLETNDPMITGSSSLTSAIIHVPRISINDAGMNGADFDWIVQGLQTLLRPDWYIQGDARACLGGAEGRRVLYLNTIASVSLAKPTNTTASAPHENIAPAEGIPLLAEGGTFVIPVLINGQITLNFTIDSGAADVSIPADVVSTLIRTGTIQKSDFIGQRTYRLADGSTAPSATFVIRSLKVGNHLLENVTGSIASAQADLLLGQSFLSRFNSWSIDNKRRVLLLN
jgi:predicted aspartyl protease